MKIIFKSCLIFIFFFSCSSWKEQLNLKGEKEEARINAIIDFVNTSSSKHKVFIISEFDNSDSVYFFDFFRERKITPTLQDTIGSVPSSYFPTKFIEKNNKLFLWGYSKKGNVITKEIVHKMQKYNIIDSLYYKIKRGEIPKGTEPILLNDSNEKATSYFICKNDILKYQKIESAKVLNKEDYPVLICNDNFRNIHTHPDGKVLN
ncbi:hypothetical protein [Pontimicrobium sp. MEBiC01747]